MSDLAPKLTKKQRKAIAFKQRKGGKPVDEQKDLPDVDVDADDDNNDDDVPSVPTPISAPAPTMTKRKRDQVDEAPEQPSKKSKKPKPAANPTEEGEATPADGTATVAESATPKSKKHTKPQRFILFVGKFHVLI